MTTTTLRVWFGEEAFSVAYAEVRNQSRSLSLVSADDIDRWREAAGPVVLAKMFEWSVAHLGYAPDVANMAGDHQVSQLAELKLVAQPKMAFADECAEP